MEKLSGDKNIKKEENGMSKSFQSNIRKAYIFQFLISLHFIGGVLIPFFIDWGKIGFSQIMILQSWFVIWSLLLEVPTGAIADFLGRKISIALACPVNVLAVIIYTSKPDFHVFLIGEFLWAMSAALISGAYEALIYDSLKRAGQENQSKKVFGRFSSFHMIGIMVAAPIGSVIAASFGLKWTMLLMAIPYTIAFFIALTFKEPKIKERVESMRYLRILSGGMKYFYTHKILRPLALNGVIINILSFFLIWTYQLLLKQLNVSLAYFGMVHLLIAGSELIVMNSFEKLEKIFGSKSRYLVFSAVISGVVFMFLGINVYVIPAILGILVVAGFGLSRFVLVSNYIQKHIESSNRATVLSAIAMFERFGLVISYPLVGLLVKWSLSYALIALGVIMLICTLTLRVKEGHLID